VIRNLRWYVAGMLMLATTISYLDRQSLAVALPALRTSIGLSSEQYSNILSAFMIAYGIMLPISGWIMDVIGVRRGFILAILWWSAASCAHAVARGAGSLMVFRFLLGMGEAGNFPGGVKAISEWFPAHERATATGIFNLGAGTGAVLAPPLVGWLVWRFGWQAAFLVTGCTGFLWVISWLILYQSPERNRFLSPAERDYIRDGRQETQGPSPGESRGSWKQTMSQREIWPLVAGRILSDPVWLFYLMWLPDYLNRVRGFNLKDLAMFAWIPYLAADLGSVFGGMLSSFLVRRGLPTLKARKLAMCMCASLMPVAIPAVLAQSWVSALLFISIATFGHQSWSASFITLPADLFPRRIVASAYGLTAMCGFFAGAAFMLCVGRVVDTVGYVPVFTMAGLMHLIGTAILVVSIRPASQRLQTAPVSERP
jgi:MFS transporter, ACS family, hexuronate transporter